MNRRNVVTLTVWLSAAVLLPVTAWTQTPIHAWSSGFGSPSYEAGLGVATDDAGNVFAVGAFTGSLDLGGGPIVTGGLQDVFLAKYDSEGNHLWSRGFGGSAADFIGLVKGAVAVDASGNVLICGGFRNSADFGGGALTSAGSADIFIAKYDAAGNHLLSARFGGTGFDAGNAIAIDPSGNVLVTGEFSETVDFGGGGLTSAGAGDIFVAKYTASGGHVWSQRFGNASGNQRGLGITATSADQALVTGYFNDQVNFGGGTLTSAGSDDIFVAKFSSSGAHLWSRGFGNTRVDAGYDVAVDAADHVFLTGEFAETVSFGGVPLTAVRGDVFVVKLDPSGNHIWSQSAGGPWRDQGFGIDVDGFGNLSIAGVFQDSLDVGGSLLTGAGGNDIFVARLDGLGNHIWSAGFGDTANETAYDIATDAAGNVALSGRFEGGVDFGGGLLTSAGGFDVFVARWRGCESPDTVPPVIGCQDIALDVGAGGACTVTLHPDDVAVVDNCDSRSDITVTSTSALPITLDPGDHTITWIAEDQAGNVSSCDQLISVVDGEAPTFASCPPPLYVTAPATVSKAQIDALAPGATDNCTAAGQIAVANNAPAGGFTDAGLDSVLWTATDESGNVATCWQRIGIRAPPQLNLSGPASAFWKDEYELTLGITNPSSNWFDIVDSRTDIEEDGVQVNATILPNHLPLAPGQTAIATLFGIYKKTWPWPGKCLPVEFGPDVGDTVRTFDYRVVGNYFSDQAPIDTLASSSNLHPVTVRASTENIGHWLLGISYSLLGTKATVKAVKLSLCKYPWCKIPGACAGCVTASAPFYATEAALAIAWAFECTQAYEEDLPGFGKATARAWTSGADPDSNYTELVDIEYPPVTIPPWNDDWTRTAVAYLEHQIDVEAGWSAYQQTRAKLQGAIAAGDTPWIEAQSQRLIAHADFTADHLALLGPDRNEIQAVGDSLGATMDAADVQAMQDSIAVNGLPAIEMQFLMDAGWTGDEIDSLEAVIVNMDPQLVADASFADPDLDADEQQAATLVVSQASSEVPGGLFIVSITEPLTNGGVAPNHPVTIDASIVDNASPPVTATRVLVDGGLMATSLPFVWTPGGGDLGTHTIRVEADDAGGTAADERSFTVQNSPPTVNAGADVTVGPGESVEVLAGFSDIDWLQTHAATIDWGDSTTDPGSVLEEHVPPTATGSASASHVYAGSLGVYNVVVSVSDDGGLTARDTLRVQVGVDCEVFPTAIGFGNVRVGESAEASFTIKNSFGAVSGDVSESCDQLSIVSGGGAYTLQSTDSLVVTVRFEPTVEGTHMCTIETGNAACENVAAVGVGHECLAALPSTFSWWPLDETSGTTAEDVVGDRDGAHVNGPTPVLGVVDNALEFDGVDDYVQVPDSPELNITGDVTVHLWFRPDAGGLQQLLNKGARAEGGVDVASTYLIEIDSFGPGTLVSGFETSSGSNRLMSVPFTADSLWHFVAYRRAGNTHQMHLDGAVIASQTFSGSPGATPGYPLLFGAIWHEGGRTRYLNGALDEIELYDYALDPAELLAIYNAGSAGRCKVPTSVQRTPTPTNFALYQNVPNPFNPMTTIHYDVPEGGGFVALRIYDVRGRLVRTLVHERKPAGHVAAIWNGRSNSGEHVATGLYLYRLDAGDFTRTRKMILVR